MVSPLFCDSCHTLHSGVGFNHFQVLGLEPTYDLDAAELRRLYLQRSREIHPDHHGETAENAGVSVHSSARLNEAFRVLRDPFSRAEYLLEMHGGKSSAEDKGVPQEILTQTLMLREEIEEARQAGDEAALDAIRQQTRQQHDAAQHEVAEMARRLPGDEEVRTALRQKLNTIKYYQKLLESL